MKKFTWRTRALLKLLEYTRYGRVRFDFPNGSSYDFGEGELLSSLIVHDVSAFDRILTRGDLGLAEGIIDGNLEISHLPAFIRWACLNDDRLHQAFHGKFWGTLIPRLQRLFQGNSQEGARKNIMAHYDLSNEFYQLWLDPTMSYSSALFGASPPSSLEELRAAQLRKYDRIIEGLNITAKDRVLEIGCGWGGFFSRAVEKTGCHVTAVLNSPSQASYNRDLIQRRKLGANVDLRLMDYRQIEGRFDKIVSIEMIEAVGEKYWGQYFGKIAETLQAKGAAMIQAITMREDRFEDYRASTDFIKKYIFPGGMLLSNLSIHEQSRKAGLQDEAPFEFGADYAQTLRLWRERFDAQKSEFLQLGFNEPFQRMWNLYLAYCEGAFSAQRINVGQFLIHKI